MSKKSIDFRNKICYNSGMKKYFNHRVKKAVEVQSLITIEALTLSPTFSYPQEIHEFYEFAFVENGKLSCTLDEKTVELSGGDFLLIPPSKTHSYFVAPAHTAEIFIVCFRCNSELLTIFDRKIALKREEKALIEEIVKEAKNAFSFPFKRKLRLLGLTIGWSLLSQIGSSILQTMLGSVVGLALSMLVSLACSVVVQMITANYYLTYRQVDGI